MGRTASPVTPGTSPTTSTDTIDTAADSGLSALDPSNPDKTGTALEGEANTGKAQGASASDAPDLQAQLAVQQKEIDDLKALVRQVTRNQASAAAEPVKLPSMAATLKQKPEIPVLTEDGWYVPAVHPTDRLSKG